MLRPRGADWLTLANGVCGLLAILLLVRGWVEADAAEGVRRSEIILAGSLMLAGGCFDVLDGLAARRFGGSGLGDHLDLLSDIVTFCLAPAVLLAAVGSGWSAPADGLAIAVGAALFVCVALRLSRHAASPHSPELGFQGLPSPAAAGCVVGLAAIDASPGLTLIGVGLLALLMLTDLPYPHQQDVVGGTCVALCIVVALLAVSGTVTFELAAAWGIGTIAAAPALHALRLRLRSTRRADTGTA